MGKVYDAFSQALSNTIGKMFQPEPMGRTTQANYEDLRDDTLYDEYANEKNRGENLAMYTEMDETSPEFSDALDSLSDLIIQGDDVQMNGYKTVTDPNASNKAKKDDVYKIGYVIDAKVKNEAESTKIEKIIKDLEDRLELKYKLKYYIRNALKFGDYFGQIVYGEKKTSKQKVIAEILDISPDKVTIHKDAYGRLNPEKPYELIMTSTSNKPVVYLKHEMFRIQMGGVADYEYGRSIAHPARKVYQQLMAVETGMVVGRLVRSHQRYLYKIDTTNMAPDVALEFVKKIKTMMTKRKMTDKNGNLIYAKSPMTAEEDIYLPVKTKSNDDVTILKSDEFLKNIDDVMYLKDKYLRALKVQSFGSADSKGSRNAVSELQVATTQYVKSVQHLVRYSLEKLYNMELALHGISTKVMIEMPAISSILTMRTWDIERLKAETCKVYSEAKILSKEHLREYVLNLNDQQLAEEKTRDAAEEAKAIKMIELAKPPRPAVAANNPQGGGSARTTTGFKNKKLKSKGNAYTTPRNSTESIEKPTE